MKILHSADWHLGKKLKHFSRIEEQKQFLADFKIMADNNDVDLIIVAGDIFDTENPPDEAVRLLYSSLKDLSNNGSRLILLIAGNHDSPEQLSAVSPLAMEHGIIIAGTPKTIIPTGDYGKHKIINSAEGMIEVEVNNEKAVILTVPYPSEKRLNEILYGEMVSKEEKLKSFNDRIVMLFEKLGEHFRDDTINLVTTHLFTEGVETSNSERLIELGGTLILDAKCFPQKAQYVALGHIHKPQIIKGSDGKVRYSGSPIHYSASEIKYDKECVLVDVHSGEDATITTIPVPVYKPIEVLRCISVEHAIQLCEENKDREFYAYIEVEIGEDAEILRSDQDTMYGFNEFIIKIDPVAKKEQTTAVDEDDIDIEGEEDSSQDELSLIELFEGYFDSKRKTKKAKTESEIEQFNEIKGLLITAMSGEIDDPDLNDDYIFDVDNEEEDTANAD